MLLNIQMTMKDQKKEGKKSLRKIFFGFVFHNIFIRMSTRLY